MQLRVSKCDGSTEVYLHTKVMGSISAALSESAYAAPNVAEELAEAVTTFIKKRHGCGYIDADEIHSMIKVVLSGVGMEQAALRLHEHRVKRQIRRSRLMVVACQPQCRVDLDGWSDVFADEQLGVPWDKSVIARDLVVQLKLAPAFARAVAGSVEERVLRLGCRRVTTALVRELVSNELLAMRHAQVLLDDEKQGAKDGEAIISLAV